MFHLAHPAPHSILAWEDVSGHVPRRSAHGRSLCVRKRSLWAAVLAVWPKSAALPEMHPIWRSEGSAETGYN